MRSIYNINFTRAALLLLPIGLRKKTLTAFVKAFMLPLELLNEDFATYRSGVDTSVLSQICYMRALLNDYFDYYERRIKVRTRPLNREYYLFWKRRNDKPVMICSRNTITFKPYMISKRWQIGAREPDFDIILPIGYNLSDNERNQMTAIVNEHKLASTKFAITHG